jgi:HEAT repeat protein
VQALVSLTADRDRREPSIAALGRLPITACAHVGAGLSDPRVEVRCSVVEALGRMRHEQATKWLHRALDDAAPEVRKAAVATLVHLGSRGAESRLAALVQSDPDAAVRSAARAAFDVGRGRPIADGKRNGG